jgi:small acid-soluble spore protein H (minor)
MKRNNFNTNGVDNMNVNRAKEISSMGEMVNVQYEGESIYIQSVNEEQETARIFSINNPQAEKNVPVDHLTEL